MSSQRFECEIESSEEKYFLFTHSQLSNSHWVDENSNLRVCSAHEREVKNGRRHSLFPNTEQHIHRSTVVALHRVLMKLFFSLFMKFMFVQVLFSSPRLLESEIFVQCDKWLLS